MELPIVPLRTMVLFPHAALPMTLNRATASQAVAAAGEDGLIAVVTQARPEAETPGSGDLYTIGTGAVVRQLTQPVDDTVMVILEGLERIAIVDLVQTRPYLRARVRRLSSERPRVDAHYSALRSNLLDAFQDMVQLSQLLPDELAMVARGITDDSALTDMIASALVESPPAVRQDILATLDVEHRMDKLCIVLARELESLKIRDQLRTEVQQRIAGAQREMVLPDRSRALAAVPRRGSLRSREGQGAHPRVPRRPTATSRAAGSLALPRRATGRRQDVGRQVDRPGNWTRIRADLARRHQR
jgi:ATP-dependent Lon protease